MSMVEAEKTPLSQIGVFLRGKGITKTDLTDSGVPCLRYAEIYTSFDDVVTKLNSVVSKEAALRATPIHNGDIIFATSGETAEEIGKAIAYLGSDPAVAGGDTVVLRGHGQDPCYLAYALNGQEAVRQKARLGKGNSIVHIHAKDLGEIRVPLPPLTEQRKIAEILRTWDEAIEKLEELKAANLRRRTYLRTHVFTGAVRLPGFSGVWQDTQLAKILSEHGLKSTGKEEVFSVSVHKGLVNQIKHLGRSFAATQTGHYNRVLPGDIVYTKSPTGDFPLGIIKQSTVEDEVIVSPLYGVFTPLTQALGMILNAYFESPITVRNFLYPLVQKGAKNTISITNRRFLEGVLKLPMDPAEQTAIAAVIAASQDELVGIEAEIKALTRQKRGLMQKLLTGEWRVPVERRHD